MSAFYDAFYTMGWNRLVQDPTMLRQLELIPGFINARKIWMGGCALLDVRTTKGRRIMKIGELDAIRPVCVECASQRLITQWLLKA